MDNQIAIREQVRQIATEDADDLAVMQYLAQVATTAQLIKLRKLEESKIPLAVKSYDWVIGDTLSKLNLKPMWISLTLENKSTSGGVLYYKINGLDSPITNESPIGVGDSISYDFEYPFAHTLYLQAESGATCDVSAHAVLGRE